MVCERDVSCPWQRSPPAAHDPLFHFFSLAAEHTFKDRYMKASSKNTSPSISSVGERIITQKRLTDAHHCTQALRCSWYHLRKYRLKHKIGFSSPCPPPSCYCPLLLLSFTSSASVIANWNPAYYLTQTLPVCSCLSSLTLCSISVGKLMSVTCSRAILSQHCLQHLCSTASRRNPCFGLPVTCSS